MGVNMVSIFDFYFIAEQLLKRFYILIRRKIKEIETELTSPKAIFPFLTKLSLLRDWAVFLDYIFLKLVETESNSLASASVIIRRYDNKAADERIILLLMGVIEMIVVTAVYLMKREAENKGVLK